MSVEIQFLSFPEVKGFRHVVKSAAEATLQDQGIDNGIVSVVLTDEDGICKLNRLHAGVDEPTDVLSFPDGETDPETGFTILGDIILCPLVAQGGAAKGRHSLLDELCMLTVHGMLHLLGYEHETEDQRSRMWEAQARVLRRVGSPARPD